MKRIFAAILAMLLLCGGALAEELLSFDTYSQTFASLSGETWKEDGAASIQTIRPEDGVTVSVCLDGQDVAALTVEFPSQNPTETVWSAIEHLGWLSESAMDQLKALQDDETAEIEGFQVVRIHGESRDAYCICSVECYAGVVWQPIHGGKKLHSKCECSGMDVARMLTEEAAAQTGWENCQKCRKNP